jgi:hypothetical protein
VRLQVKRGLAAFDRIDRLSLMIRSNHGTESKMSVIDNGIDNMINPKFTLINIFVVIVCCTFGAASYGAVGTFLDGIVTVAALWFINRHNTETKPKH